MSKYWWTGAILVLTLIVTIVGCGESTSNPNPTPILSPTSSPTPGPSPTSNPNSTPTSTPIAPQNFLFSQQDLENVRIKSNSGYTSDVFNLMKTRADTYLGISTDPYTYFRAGSDAISGRAMQIHVLLSAFTGFILNDDRYINKAIAILCAAAQSTTVQDAYNMNDALAISDAAYAYAIGYTWLYEFMSADQRILIRNEINQYGQWLYDRSTGLNGATQKEWGYANNSRRAWNWNGDTHGALGLCGLALGNQQWIDRAVERCTDYLEYGVDSTGAAREGISYLSYGLHFVIPFAVGLKNMTGRDIIASAIASGSGVLNISDYLMHQTYPWGGNTVPINQDGGLEPAEGVFYLLTRNNDETGLWSWLHVVGNSSNGGNGTYGQRNWLGLGACLPYILLWADSSLGTTSPISEPLSSFYSKGDVAARTGWEDLDYLMTFTCGSRYSSIWNHADAGAVTLAAKGDIFLTDVGPGTSSTSVKISSKYHNVVLIDGVGQSKVYGDGSDYGNIHSTAYPSTRTAQAERDNSVYASGDLTAAYNVNSAQAIEHAYRQVFFKRSPHPYFIVVDDVKKNTATHTYLSQYFTPSGNTNTVDDVGKKIIIIGSVASCQAVFYSPLGTVTVSEDTSLTSSTGCKVIKASVQGVSAKIVSLFYPFDNGSTPPVVTMSGGSDDITVTLQYSDTTSETLHITPSNIN